MKALFILLAVVALTLTGCNKTAKADTLTYDTLAEQENSYEGNIMIDSVDFVKYVKYCERYDCLKTDQCCEAMDHGSDLLHDEDCRVYDLAKSRINRKVKSK